MPSPRFCPLLHSLGEVWFGLCDFSFVGELGLATFLALPAFFSVDAGLRGYCPAKIVLTGTLFLHDFSCEAFGLSIDLFQFGDLLDCIHDTSFPIDTGLWGGFN